MPRLTIGPPLPDRETLGIEIARLRDLDIEELRSRWHTVLGRPPPSHLPRHLLYRVVAYRLQADRRGTNDPRRGHNVLAAAGVHRQHEHQVETHPRPALGQTRPGQGKQQDQPCPLCIRKRRT
jgi:Protein of unknown function (DUF2924)